MGKPMIEFKGVSWVGSTEQRALIAPAFSHYRDDLELICQELEQGRCALYQLTGCGHIVVKLLQHIDHAEFFIVAGVGENLIAAMPVIERKARRHGFDLITMHTRRRGLVRRMRREFGYQCVDDGDEWICQRGLKYG